MITSDVKTTRRRGGARLLLSGRSDQSGRERVRVRSRAKPALLRFGDSTKAVEVVLDAVELAREDVDWRPATTALRELIMNTQNTERIESNHSRIDDVPIGDVVIGTEADGTTVLTHTAEGENTSDGGSA